MSDGHCRHCEREGCDPGGNGTHVNIYGIEWPATANDSHCPGCQEAERTAGGEV